MTKISKTDLFCFSECFPESYFRKCIIIYNSYEMFPGYFED